MGRILNNAEKFEAGIAFGCEPPTTTAKKIARFEIHAGTPCLVTKVSQVKWVSHKTKIDLSFERFERYKNGAYTFRFKGMLIEVQRRWVFHREDRPGYNVGK